MLQAYAFARPSVRLCLKVLKAKSDKGNWTYVPKPDANVPDAVVKILGKKVSDHCQWVIWDSENGGAHSVLSVSGVSEQSINLNITYKIEAFVPKADGGESVSGMMGSV